MRTAFRSKQQSDSGSECKPDHEAGGKDCCLTTLALWRSRWPIGGAEGRRRPRSRFLLVSGTSMGSAARTGAWTGV